MGASIVKNLSPLHIDVIRMRLLRQQDVTLSEVAYNIVAYRRPYRKRISRLMFAIRVQGPYLVRYGHGTAWKDKLAPYCSIGIHHWVSQWKPGGELSGCCVLASPLRQNTTCMHRSTILNHWTWHSAEFRVTAALFDCLMMILVKA